MKKLLIISLTALYLASCSSSSSSSSSSAASTIDSSSEESSSIAGESTYDYSLKSDEEKGRAIYPDEAYRLLKEIQSHNIENGVPWPENEAYSCSCKNIHIEDELLSNYDIQYENYVPGEYYLWEKNLSFLHNVAEGYFYDEGEFFHGYYDNEADPEVYPYYESSDVSEMEEAAATPLREYFYQCFLDIVDAIEHNEFGNVIYPQEIECYTAGPGSLYINIYHTDASVEYSDQRIIRRVVYEDYLPVFAINQRVINITEDDDYTNSYSSVSFTYGEAEVKDNLAWYFERRVDA